MEYLLRIYDNYYYSDGSEAYDHGQYTTYEDALKEAKAIINKFLENNWEKGMEPEYLLSLYELYGEEPIIVSNDPKEIKPFSARAYAGSIALKLCRKLEIKFKKSKPQKRMVSE